jgi:GNAT superfamily N-acetyltransferase
VVAAGSAQDTVGGDARPASEQRPSGPAAIRRRILASAAIVLAVALLFVAYLQVSRTYPENSDESNTLLMAWDMLHGNVLLHGWSLSDVSFYTTELPQYVMLERFIGLHTDTAHVAAAMTYTLVVILAALLARGSTSGRAAWPRMLLTTGIMFAPQLGVAVFVLLLSVGHIGTSVPLLLTWLVLDRAVFSRGGDPPGSPRSRGGSPPPRPPPGGPFGGPRLRWAVPVIVGLLLTWVLIADPLVLVVGIVPLIAVCAVRVVRGMTAARRQARQGGQGGQGGQAGGWLLDGVAAQRYEVSLAVAAILAEGLASLVNRLLRASGGFILHPVGYQLAPLRTWPKHAWVTGEGLLALFGAKPQGPAVELIFALVHLAGVALVVWAMCRVARHFFSWPDMISQILLVAMVLNVVLYVPSTLADATDLNAREFAVVLPFGAVLAARTLAAGLGARESRQRKWLAPVLLAALAGYAASLGYAAAQPSVPAANERLGTFLAAHHLTSGIGGYWESSVVTVGSDGAVTIRAVVPGSLQPDLWESKSSWYDARSNRATFLVTDSASGFFNYWQPNPAAVAAFGRPARTYHVGPYTIFVWDKNLLVLLGRG